jgi:hypothetical protein
MYDGTSVVNELRDLRDYSDAVLVNKSKVQLVRNVNNAMVDMARGLNSEIQSVRGFGRNASTSTTVQDIWIVGGNYPFQTTADKLVVVSNNTNDADGGLGAQKVRLFGLDTNWNQIDEEVTLVGNGESLPTTNSFIRIDRAQVTDVGTYAGSNYNILSINRDVSAVTVSSIRGGYGGGIDTSNYGLGRSELGIYSIPAGYTGYVLRIGGSIDLSGNKTGTIRLFKRICGNDVTTPFWSRQLIWSIDNIQGTFEVRFESPLVLPEYTDIWFRGSTSGAGTISVKWDMVLMKD